MRNNLAIVAGAVVFAGTACAQNIVVNGSFEDPQVAGVDQTDGNPQYFYSRPATTPFLPWVVTPGQSSIVLRSRADFWVAQDGNQYVEVESGFSGFWQQTLPTIVGQRYLVSFYYAANPFLASTSNDDAMRVLFGGTALLVIDQSSVDLNHLNWTLHQFTITASSENAVIRFEDAVVGAAFNGGYLDNVSVVAVPAPAAAGMLGLGVLAVSRRRRA